MASFSLGLAVTYDFDDAMMLAESTNGLKSALQEKTRADLPTTAHSL